MARLGIGTRIIALFVLIIGLVVGGLFWFDFLGVISAEQVLSPITSVFGVKKTSVDIDDPALLDTIRYREQEESLDQKLQQLGSREDELKKRDQQVAQKATELDEREKAQADREKSFKDKVQAYDDVKRNLERNSKDLTSMPPEKAVDILLGYDDQQLIDTLRVTQELADKAGTASLVSFWLSKMPKERAAEIQRKMTLKPNLPD